MPPKSRRRTAAYVPAVGPLLASGHTPSVSSVLQAFQTWIPFSILQLSTLMTAAGHPTSDDSLGRSLCSFTLSTAFSGVGGPDNAFHNLGIYFAYVVTSLSIGDFVLNPLWAIEMDDACRAELLCSEAYSVSCFR